MPCMEVVGSGGRRGREKVKAIGVIYEKEEGEG